MQPSIKNAQNTGTRTQIKPQSPKPKSPIRKLFVWALGFKKFVFYLGFVQFVLCVFSTPAVNASFVPDVPFTSQAPFYDWREPWQSFCEEASVVMAAHFLWGLPLTPKIAAEEMLIIKKYEELTLEKYKDTSAEETAEILRDLYGFKKVSVKEIKSSSDIEKEILRGNIIITPVAGRLLKNPYFVSPGPLYHMLVIKSFDETHFITNDPGTRRGENLKYRKRVLYNAVHDWNGGDVLNGKKEIIVIGG